MKKVIKNGWIIDGSGNPGFQGDILLAEGKIDFAIEESPFQHGYRSGEAIFKYLLSQEVLPPKSCLFCGNILLEENSSD